MDEKTVRWAVFSFASRNVPYVRFCIRSVAGLGLLLVA